MKKSLSESAASTELAELRIQLEEAENTLNAIRSGEAYALLITGKDGYHVYLLSAYRQIIETMSEGAATLSNDGILLYCNLRFAEMLGVPLKQILGTPLQTYIHANDQQVLASVLKNAFTDTVREELNLKTFDGGLAPVSLSASRLQSRSEKEVFSLIITDLTEQKQHEKTVEAERLARLILEQAVETIIVCDEEGRIIRISQAARQFCDQDPLTHPFSKIFPLQTGMSEPLVLDSILRGESLKNMDVSLEFNGQIHNLLMNAGPLNSGKEILGCVVVLTDITERKRLETYRDMSRSVLQILNEPGDIQSTLQHVLGALKSQTGFDAIGLRLKSGEDFPYLAQEGFSEDFLQKENSLLARSPKGGICRKPNGEACLECSCGLVLSGDADLSLSFFTPGGSCWTNDSAAFLNSPPGEEPRFHPRNECIRRGYASVALIPIKTQEGIVGLIQFNDRRKGRFSLATLELLENIASKIGVVLTRKQTEDQLERIARFPRENPNPVIRVTVDGILEYANPAAEILLPALGVSGLGDSVNPEWVHTVENAFAGKQAVLSEYTWQEKTYEISLTPVTGQNYVNLYARDVTEKKRAEEALLTSQNLLAEIINTIPIRVFWKDRNLKYMGCNTAFAEDAGFAGQEEVVGKTDSQLIWKAHAESYNADDRKAIAGESLLNTEEKRTTSEGENRVLLKNKVPLQNSEGEIIGMLGTYIDITDQRLLEEQYRQAQKMESVGRLAGGVAHDFNNMLQVILGYTEIAINSSGPNSPIAEELQVIMKAALSSAALTQQLLTFARKEIVSPQVLDLNNTVSEMLKMLQRLIGEEINLIWQPGSNLHSIRIDPTQVNQIIANLCINARDAIEGTGHIILKTKNIIIDKAYCAMHSEAVPGSYVCLSVSDDGCGMSRETLANIFEPFFTTKGLGKGTGLGLATVYGIIKQNEGFIYAYSEPGQGTVFNIYLPIVREKSDEPIEETLPTPTKALKETILVVEDEPALLSLCTLFLNGLGYTVLSASIPSEALSLMENHPEKIQLLLTDMVMPEMNGQQLAEKIRATHPDIQVLFMSGYAAGIMAEKGVLATDAKLITKPFSVAELARELRALLDAQ